MGVEISDRSYIGIVGPSGSGKSSLVELLVRFRDPDEGRVTIGETDLRDFDPNAFVAALFAVGDESPE